jgi:hypothetical protein
MSPFGMSKDRVRPVGQELGSGIQGEGDVLIRWNSPTLLDRDERLIDRPYRLEPFLEWPLTTGANGPGAGSDEKSG